MGLRHGALRRGKSNKNRALRPRARPDESLDDEHPACRVLRRSRWLCAVCAVCSAVSVGRLRDAV